MIYAIGDIHGHKAALDRALALIEADSGGGDAETVFLGDYADRGPDTRGVVQCLLDGVNAGRNWTVLRGNHDRLFTRFVRRGTVHDAHIKSGKGWLHPALGGGATLAAYSDLPGFLHPQGGGVETLLSYGLDPTPTDLLDDLLFAARAGIPEEHIAFLESRPLWHETDELIFVHAGLRPGIPLADQQEDDLIWIRDGWLDDTRDHGKLVVHGHTALEYPRHHGNRVNIDGGAGFGRPLIPVAIEGRDCWLLTDNGREPLLPDA